MDNWKNEMDHRLAYHDLGCNMHESTHVFKHLSACTWAGVSVSICTYVRICTS